MRIKFQDNKLRRLYVEPDYRLPQVGPELTRAFRKKVGFLAAAQSERDVRNSKALRLEKLKADHAGQHSIRLNRQWRLILRIENDESGPLLTVLKIEDYH